MTNHTCAKILVVDDTETNIDILAKFLGGEYDIDTAASGPKALQSAAVPPDLILLDVLIPERQAHRPDPRRRHRNDKRGRSHGHQRPAARLAGRNK